MSAPFLFLWVFLAVSVLATGTLWKVVRSLARDGLPRVRSRKSVAVANAQYEAEQARRERQARDARDAATLAQRRRDDARAKCELLFTVYAPEIGKRFTKQMLDAFIRNYMSDSRPPEEVEERARHLEEILAEHRSAVRPAPRFRNIQELANWYVTEKQRIEDLPVDDMFKEQHLVQLHTLYAELTQQVMEQQS